MVELALSLAMTSILTLGLVQLFSANQAGARLVHGQAAVSEAGRFALEILGSSLQQAGYRGCNALAEPVDLPLNPPYEFDLLRGLQGYEASGASWTPALLTAGLPTTQGSRDQNIYAAARRRTGVNLNALRPGTDLVTVWFAASADYPVVDPATSLATGREDLLLAASPAEVADDLEQDSLALLSDCTRASLFMITAISGGNQARLAHDSLRRAGATGNASRLLGGGAGFLPGAVVSPIVSRTFYVGQATSANRLGNPVFSLFLKEGLRRPVELIEGVEDLQLLYGLATGGEAAPSVYLDASQVGDFGQVVSVRIEVTASSIDSVGASTADGILRRPFSRTVQLRNRLRPAR